MDHPSSACPYPVDVKINVDYCLDMIRYFKKDTPHIAHILHVWNLALVPVYLTYSLEDPLLVSKSQLGLAPKYFSDFTRNHTPLSHLVLHALLTPWISLFPVLSLPWPNARQLLRQVLNLYPLWVLSQRPILGHLCIIGGVRVKSKLAFCPPSTTS